MSSQPENVSKQKQQQQQQQQQPQDKKSIVSTIVESLRPSPTVDVFPSAIGSKETTPLGPPTSLSHQGLAGMFSTPNFTPSFGIRIPLDNVDQDMANRLEKVRVRTYVHTYVCISSKYMCTSRYVIYYLTLLYCMYHMYIQWTLIYPDFFYPEARIIRTPNFQG